ncbi:MAG TPA: hypothetical protein VJW20_14185 [Candidatus Angelobacter sp.]|nr:hypothetical protein [Candidatus Angelobacter sp.]
MVVNEYARMLEKAKKELADLKEQRSDLQSQLKEVDERITKQQKGIEGLAHLADQQNMAALPIGAVKPLAKFTSFTDAVCYTLTTVPKLNLTPMQVRERLHVLGYDLTKYKSNPVASIHTILKRLVEAGKVTAERNEIGKIAYRWLTEEAKVENELG